MPRKKQVNKTISNANTEVMDATVGKTIASVDSRACNFMQVNFTDGTSIFLEAEAIFPSMGLHGIRAGVVEKKDDSELQQPVTGVQRHC
jgi:hypothetical protein